MRQQAADDLGTLVPATIGRPLDPAALAQARLSASPYLELRVLACDSHEGVLAIRGRVPSFYLKQLAQATVRDVPGVEVIHNQVQVAPTCTNDR
jgi:hypothetical protein